MSHISKINAVEFQNVELIYLDANKHTVVVFKSGLAITLPDDPTNADLLSEYRTYLNPPTIRKRHK